MNFETLIKKINLKIKSLEENPLTEVELAAEEISHHLYTLESMFSSEWQQWLNNNKFLDKFYDLEQKVLTKLDKEQLTYSLISELNQIYIKNSKNQITQQVSISNLPEILKRSINLTSENETFFVLKSLFTKNHRLEILALAIGLKIV